VRTPRRAAVMLSALALSGALAACNGGEAQDDPVVNDPGVGEPGGDGDPVAPGDVEQPD
jgi:hypothetical protein